MKLILAAAIAASTLAIGGGAVAQPMHHGMDMHHRHGHRVQVCTMHHHHRVCRMEWR